MTKATICSALRQRAAKNHFLMLFPTKLYISSISKMSLSSEGKRVWGMEGGFRAF
ncbi:MAG: hypothetical protein NZ805_14345 [Armatimonadetes bacterium]|nr:hypothetical protein [Armatimonadota bacterium]